MIALALVERVPHGLETEYLIVALTLIAAAIYFGFRGRK